MIEIEGLPEGFEINSVTINAGETISQCFNTIQATIHLKKIKPREIVLEEISKEEYHRLFNDERCSDIYNMRGSYWREVEETEEPKLSLGVDECKEAMRKLETFNVTDLSVKICRFLKENS